MLLLIDSCNRNGRGDNTYTPMKFLKAARYSFATANKKYFDLVQDILTEDPLLGGSSDSDEEEENENQVLLYMLTTLLSTLTQVLFYCRLKPMQEGETVVFAWIMKRTLSWSHAATTTSAMIVLL